MNGKKINWGRVFLVVLPMAAVLLALYLLLFTNFFTVRHYTSLFRKNEELFKQAALELSKEDELYAYPREESGDLYKALAEAGVEVVKSNDGFVYFQLYSTIKYGSGIFYSSYLNVPNVESYKAVNAYDWFSRIDGEQTWYVYQNN